MNKGRDNTFVISMLFSNLPIIVQRAPHLLTPKSFQLLSFSPILIPKPLRTHLEGSQYPDVKMFRATRSGPSSELLISWSRTSASLEA